MKCLHTTYGYTTRSACVQALMEAGLSLLPESTGVRYSAKELLSIREMPGGPAYDDWRERRATATWAVAGRREKRIAS